MHYLNFKDTWLQIKMNVFNRRVKNKSYIHQEMVTEWFMGSLVQKYIYIADALEI